MKHRHVPLGYLDISDNAKKYVNQAMDNNRLSSGPFVKQFEKEFAKEHDCQYSIFMNSGTSALQVALAALKEKYGYQDGDEVLVPAITFIATSNIVLQLGLKPVFVDVDPNTYNMDPDNLLDHMSTRTRCIIPVHLFGLPADMESIMKFARKFNLQVIEDSCETMFVGQNNKKVGSFGDFGCFSTYVAHLLITGVGGIITTNNREDEELCRSIMTHGRDKIYLNIDDDKDVKGDLLKSIVERRFSFVRMGYSYRATELEGALGVGALEQKDAMMGKRKRIAEAYYQNLLDLAGHKLQLPIVSKNNAYMMFPIVVKQGSRDDLTMLLEEHGVETRYMMPLLNQPYYKQLFGDIEKDYPVANWIDKNGFYVPCHDGMTEEDVEHIAGVIHHYYGGM